MMSSHQNAQVSLPEEKRRTRISKILEEVSFRSPNGGDVRLTVVAKDGFRASMEVHKSVLVEKSRFFAEKLMRCCDDHEVEISDCDDVEVYVETVVLMYFEDLKKRLVGEGVSKVLSLLKVIQLN